MQVCCELCNCEFYMSSRCRTKHPKCFYCRSGMDPEESRTQHEMDDAWDASIMEQEGTSYFKPDTAIIELWGTEHMIEKARRHREADAFFYGETPSSSDK